MALVSEAFRRAKLRGAIIGGVARNHWEVPRLTFDLDFTVEANQGRVEAVIAAPADHGFEVMRQQARHDPSGPDFIQLYNRELSQIVELQGAKTPFQEELINRAVELSAGSPLFVARREDLIVLKLLAFRKKDKDDLRELASHAEIDWRYVEHWSEIWEVSENLNWLRAEIENI